MLCVAGGGLLAVEDNIESGTNDDDVSFENGNLLQFVIIFAVW